MGVREAKGPLQVTWGFGDLLLSLEPSPQLCCLFASLCDFVTSRTLWKLRNGVQHS